MNRKQHTTGGDDGRYLADRVQEDRKVDALVLLDGPIGDDDKGYLLRLALAMTRWASAGALAAEGGEQGAYARQAVDWVATYARVAKATLPGEIRQLEQQLSDRAQRAVDLRALKGGRA